MLKEIAASIIDLASSLKTEGSDVNISSVILTIYDKRLHQKGCEVSDHSREKCKANNLYLIDNSSRIIP